jgi:hypothetical protein
MKLLWIIVIIAFIFAVTYKPSSGTLNQYIQPEPIQEPVRTVTDAKIDEVPDCDEQRYSMLQFGKKSQHVCDGGRQEYLGAVIRN